MTKPTAPQRRLANSGLPLLDGLSAKEARDLLRYDPETGDLTWRHSHKRARAGALAGYIHPSAGYRRVKIGGTVYCTHRIIWLMVHGAWPEGEIDHINGNRVDNRLANLRSVSGATNSKNRKMPSHNTSGLVGVCWHRDAKKWQAQIRVQGKTMYLGCFENFLDAAAARYRAEREHGFHENHGRKASG